MNSSKSIKTQAIEEAEKQLVKDNLNHVIILCEKCIEQYQDNNEFKRILAFALFKKEINDKCLTLLEEIPEDNDSAKLKAILYAKKGETEKADDLFNRLMKNDPENVSLLTDYAYYKKVTEQFNVAEKCLKKAITIEPKHQEGIKQLGGLYSELNQFDKAEKLFRDLVNIEDNNDNKLDLSINLLCQGKWKEGLEKYESRLDCSIPIRYQDKIDKTRLWKGESLENKKILVFGEQGIGDIINFYRFSLFLNGKVQVMIPPSISKIFKRTENISFSEEVGEYDYCCSMMSLPYILNMSQEQVTNTFYPYVYTDKKIDLPQGFNIGICWAGNPQHVRDRYRSCRLKEFEILKDLPVNLFSLQQELKHRKWAFYKETVDLSEGYNGKPLYNVTEYMNSWSNTLAIINELDLVITIDTSIAHLSGAVGKDTLLLLPYSSDWRWFGKGDETIWYPSIRLIKQDSMHNWSGCFSEVLNQVTCGIP